MGLTRHRDGGTVRGRYTAALAGCPNVGKSTVFNALTGLAHHTGNWTGKTVDAGCGRMRAAKQITLCDLPGAYSLDALSPEERIASDFIREGGADVTIVVCDASALARNLVLALRIIELSRRTIVCVNLVDEAEKRGVRVDAKALSAHLGVPVVLTSAVKGKGLHDLEKAIIEAVTGDDGNEKGNIPTDAPKLTDERARALAARIALEVTTRDRDTRTAKQLRIDRLLSGRITGRAFLMLLLAVVFYLTMKGANYPSELLSHLFGALIPALRRLLEGAGAAPYLVGALCDGVLGTLAQVVSVMLPPMAIFFPLFTLLEDMGLLPRVAFDLDSHFRRCGTCGKQALTCCMGFGCNAAGVVGCRIIESPRERLVAVLTNSLVPCNGRFPALTAIITLFFAGGASAGADAVRALIMTGLILLSVWMTMLMSKLLSATVLRGERSRFVLELPPFRRPRIGRTLVRSMLDRTVFVLGRAAAAAAPAGLVIWLLANVGGSSSLLQRVTCALDPMGRLLGVDGAILMAFVLALPANELMLPLLAMILTGAGVMQEVGLSALGAVLMSHGWTLKTAVCTLVLMLFHSPCATTLLTIRKETKSLGWTALSALVPIVPGVILCLIINALWPL